MPLSRISSNSKTTQTSHFFNPINIYFDIFLPHSIYCFYNYTLFSFNVQNFIFTDDLVEDEDVEVIQAAPMLRQRKRRQKRPSVVAIQQDDGSSYFYDDPDLGGTGETSWTREELDVLDEGEEEEDEQGECFKAKESECNRVYGKAL